jgi:hypothetical protein
MINQKDLVGSNFGLRLKVCAETVEKATLPGGIFLLIGWFLGLRDYLVRVGLRFLSCH